MKRLTAFVFAALTLAATAYAPHGGPAPGKPGAADAQLLAVLY